MAAVFPVGNLRGIPTGRTSVRLSFKIDEVCFVAGLHGCSLCLRKGLEKRPAALCCTAPLQHRQQHAARHRAGNVMLLLGYTEIPFPRERKTRNITPKITSPRFQCPR